MNPDGSVNGARWENIAQYVPSTYGRVLCLRITIEYYWARNSNSIKVCKLFGKKKKKGMTAGRCAPLHDENTVYRQNVILPLYSVFILSSIKL